MASRDELLRLIGAARPSIVISDDTPLVSSGLLDSVALFNVLLWIEEQTGQPVDPTRIDIRHELDTVPAILALVARLTDQAAS